MITLVAAGVTTVLWRTTRDQQDATTARQLVAQAAAVRGTDPAGAVRLELAAAAIFPGDETRSALAAGLTSSRFAGVLTDAPVAQAVFTADGRTMATSATRGGVTLWDLTRGPPVRVGALACRRGRTWRSAPTAGRSPSRPPRATGRIRAVGRPTPPSPSGMCGIRRRPAPAGPTVSLADAGRARPAPGTWWPGGATALLTFSADGRTLAVAGTVMPAGVAALIDVAEPGASRRVGPPLALGATVTAIAFDRSGRALLAGTRRQSDGADVAAGPDTGDVVVWDVTDQAEPPAGPAADPERGVRVLDRAGASGRHTRGVGRVVGPRRPVRPARRGHRRREGARLGSPSPARGPPSPSSTW